MLIAERAVQVYQEVYEVYLQLVEDVCGKEVREDKLSYLLGCLLDFACDKKLSPFSELCTH